MKQIIMNSTDYKKYILLTAKPWHDELFHILSCRKGEEWIKISNKEDFNMEYLNKIQPDKIFIPHWSLIIPKSIWVNYTCVVFHMTDLPYGRGGSPLQNLIVRGHKETKITALKVNEGIDAGDFYLKHPLSLDGTAQEIYHRTVPIIKEMIEAIIDENITPEPQIGNPVVFKRRKKQDGALNDLEDLEKVFDFIRMLDADGYPPAFVETKHFRFEFSGASLNDNKEILANVRIIKK